MALSAQDDFHSLPSTGTDLALKLSDLEITELPTGFEGSMSNLTLTDVIQLEGQNHFSGSVLVVFQEQEGQIFFQQGEVVHAEAGSHSGEEAFYRILGWPGGSFKLHPNVSSLHRTVHKHREHLLLTAHQWLDESRQGQGARPTHATPGQPRDILQVIGPLVQLTEHAKEISMGNVELKLETHREDEIGLLIKSFERMRVSLKKSMAMLTRKD